MLKWHHLGGKKLDSFLKRQFCFSEWILMDFIRILYNGFLVNKLKVNVLHNQCLSVLKGLKCDFIAAAKMIRKIK